MKKNKIIGGLLILIPFIGLQFTSYYGNYLETKNWIETFQTMIGGNFLEIAGHHIWIIIGIIIFISSISINKKTN